MLYEVITCGIPIPNGMVTTTKICNIENPVVIKAQVLVGGRGRITSYNVCYTKLLRLV